MPQPAIELRRGRTAYRLRGDASAPALVLVFGGFHFPRNCDAFFDALASELGPEFAVLSYDYWGRGDSAAPDARYDERLYLEQIDGLLAALGLAERKLAVLGYSFGGSLALHFTRAHPERVAALALSGAWAAWEPFPAAARVLCKLGLGWILARAWWPSTRKAIVEGFVDRAAAVRYTDAMLEVERAIVARDPRGFERAILSTFRDYPCAREAALALSGDRRPTLLVWGEHDNVAPVATARALHAALPGSELAVLAGSHNDLWLVPDLATDLRGRFAAFLRRHSAALGAQLHGQPGAVAEE